MSPARAPSVGNTSRSRRGQIFNRPRVNVSFWPRGKRINRFGGGGGGGGAYTRHSTDTQAHCLVPCLHRPDKSPPSGMRPENLRRTLRPVTFPLIFRQRAPTRRIYSHGTHPFILFPSRRRRRESGRPRAIRIIARPFIRVSSSLYFFHFIFYILSRSAEAVATTTTIIARNNNNNNNNG